MRALRVSCCTALLVAVAALLGTSSLGAARKVSRSQSSSKPAANAIAPSVATQALLDQYCVACHNSRLRTAGLTLEKLDVEPVGDRAEIWEKVVRKVRSGAMPPAGRPRPDQAVGAAFVSSLEAALDRAAEASPNPGRIVLHRLNRAEYTNAIRDLLALAIDGRSLLPADDTSFGFDNIAEVLSVSPGLLDRYLLAARKISRVAVGDPTFRSNDRYKVSSLLLQTDRMSESLPFGSRGGLAVHHYFPADGEYMLKIRLQRGYGLNIRGIGERNDIDIRVDGARVRLLTIGGKDGDGTPSYALVENTVGPDLQARFPVKAGLRRVGITFVEKKLWAPEGLGPTVMPVATSSFAGDSHNPMGVEYVEIDGPYDATGPGDTPSRREVFVCRPTTAAGEEPCARTVLSKLARRAYRRAVTDADLGPLLEMYAAGRRERGFEGGIQRALESILASPDFLFRREGAQPRVAAGSAPRVSDVDLASRVSFFLWSSIPDEELLDLAIRGKLSDEKVLDRQVRRMLADPRAKAVTDNFGGQWLHLRDLRTLGPDPQTFPVFDENLREALQTETELFFESQVREDRPVTELLTANYSFANERLARHYGIPNVYGTHFRRVTFTDQTRGGLLGQGSILTVTSYPTRTSPVLRGKWVLDNLLGAPPPPPPPNVEGLTDKGKDGKALSMREQMEQHRKNPVCAGCHARMDPLGFSLENYDAIGRWRTTSEAATPIDASGALPDGTTFNGPGELRTLLLNRREDFATTVTEKFLTYALGRGVEYYDMPAIRRIVRDAAANEYRWSSIVLGIVKSTPFQKRRAES